MGLAPRIEYFLVMSRHIILQKGRQGQIRIGLLENLEFLDLLVEKVDAFVVAKGDESGMQTFTGKFVSINLLLRQNNLRCFVLNLSLYLLDICNLNRCLASRLSRLLLQFLV